jgi:cation:H+ antiporter
MTDWLTFAAAALIIVGAGSALAVFAEVIVSRTGLGALWFGAVAVALVTSLPELVTDISAARDGAPDLALGDLFGSSMANMGILAAVTLVFSTRRLLQRAALENVLSAMLATALTGLAIMAMVTDSLPDLGNVGSGSLALFLAYAVGSVMIRERQSAAQLDELERVIAAGMRLRVAVAGFLIAALFIVLAGPQLASSAGTLAARTGLGETFFGALALALVTSLPELAVSVAALRMGAQNLAIANLMGSNATNMALIFAVDIAYTDGPILENADPSLVVAGGGAIVLMAIGTMAIILKAERHRLPVDLAAVLMLAAYLFSLVAVYNAS